MPGAATSLAGKRGRSVRADPAGSPFFCVDLLEHRDVEVALGKKALQPCVLGFERSKALHIGGRQLTEVLAHFLLDLCSEARTAVEYVRAGADLVFTYYAKEAAGWL